MSDCTLTIRALAWPRWRNLRYELQCVAPDCDMSLTVLETGLLRKYGHLKASGPEDQIRSLLRYVKREGEQAA